ncbi:MAG TPA: multiubiquitin domain-containing protein [Thermoleophilia bacterium]|nr:multiubiquitin domain-containing protein [Thermoleophilia bacterium]
MTTQQQVELESPAHGRGGPFYTVFVDDVEFHFDHTPVTGGEIMDVAGIPHEVGLLLIHEDGTQEQIGADQEIDLRPGRRFKKAPRFKRG